MAYILFTLNVRNAEAARILQNMNNQNITVTYTYTANGTSADYQQDGFIGTLAATTASVNYPPEIGPVGTTPNVTPQVLSN